MYGRVSDNSEYERLFIKRYLNSLNDKAVMSLLKKLWKFTFRLNDQDCQANREVNGLTIRILIRRFPEQIIKLVSEDQAYYSQVSFEKAHLDEMIELFNQAPRVFSFLDEDIQRQISDKIKSLPSRYVRSWFLSLTPEDHCLNTAQFLRGMNFSSTVLWEFRLLAEEANKMDEYRKMTTYYLSQSSSYLDTYDRFRKIRQELKDYNKEQFQELLKIMNSNKQIYNAQNCSQLVDELQEVAEENLGFKLDLAPFEKLQ
ncbi:hypothetical protein D3C75_770760 [compost metagenome]